MRQQQVQTAIKSKMDFLSKSNMPRYGAATQTFVRILTKVAKLQKWRIATKLSTSTIQSMELRQEPF
jgi:hypothetical protein